MSARLSPAGSKRTAALNDNLPAWLTREETASYLRVSLRQLDRLPLPRSTAVGTRSPRFARTDLEAFLRASVVTPVATVPTSSMPRPQSRPVIGAVIATNGREWARAMRATYAVPARSKTAMARSKASGDR